MICKNNIDRISLYIDGELEEKDRIAFENHTSKCESCREEVAILQDIANSIGTLEMIDPPEGFHQELMEKIKQDSLPISKKKWYLNLKMVSAVAAVFIFSLILINPLKTNNQEEALPQMASDMAGTRMINEPMVAKEAAFDMKEVALETWQLETTDYDKYKQEINKIAKEMELELIIVEESKDAGVQSITMEVIVGNNNKNELESKIREVDETIAVDKTIPVLIQNKDMDEEENNLSTILIIINQTN